jgi:hypothetical protein
MVQMKAPIDPLYPTFLGTLVLDSDCTISEPEPVSFADATKALAEKAHSLHLNVIMDVVLYPMRSGASFQLN